MGVIHQNGQSNRLLSMLHPLNCTLGRWEGDNERFSNQKLAKFKVRTIPAKLSTANLEHFDWLYFDKSPKAETRNYFDYFLCGSFYKYSV